MIKEAYISFEVAKLLKEKGFNEPVYNSIRKLYKDERNNAYYWRGDVKENYNDIPEDKNYQMTYSCPTQQMAMAWIREECNIYISIQPDFPSDKDYKMCWCWSASNLHENCVSIKGYQCYIETYEEAVEAALKYCLENLL